MFAELCCVRIPFVFKWTHVILVSLLEGHVAKSDVCLLCGRCRNFCLINNVHVIAISVHGAGIWITAVTITITGGIRFINLGFVVVRNNWFRLKILWSGFQLGKCWSTGDRKRFPTLVFTFFLKGGLYQSMFLGQLLRDRCVLLCDSLYDRL